MSSTTSKTSKLQLKDITRGQNRTIEAVKTGNHLLIAPKGYGKCMIGQTAAQELLQEKVLRRVLVVAPLKVCELTWAQEHIVWDHLDPPAMAIGEPAARRLAVASSAGIVVVNNENLAWILNEYPQEFDGVVIDEISKYKTAGAKGVRRLRRARKHLTWVLGMTATPVAESGVDIYSQAGIVCGFKPPFKRKETFLREFFYPTDWQQRNWALLPGGGERLGEALRHVVYIPDAQAYVDSLPPLYDELIFCELPETARNAYHEMAEKMVYAGVEAANAGVVSGKLQQITQGTMYKQGGKEVVQLHTEKPRALVKLMQDLHPTRVMIGYQFRYEQDRLRNMGIPILGDDPAVLEKKWNLRQLPALAVHPLSAGHGINMQRGGHTLIMLGPIWSADQTDQLLGRLWRRGQEHAVTRYTIVARDTIDELIMGRVEGKDMTAGILMAHLKWWAEGV